VNVKKSPSRSFFLCILTMFVMIEGELQEEKENAMGSQNGQENG
jgi:hypothetical protein